MNQSGITIRFATKKDAETIADLSRQTFYETFADSNTRENMEIFLNEQFTRESLIAEVKFDSNIFLLAYSGNELAGYVKLRERDNPTEEQRLSSMEIARIYATKSMIGKGVGKMLMQHSISLAQQKQKEVVWLAVWEKNQRAIDFYRKWGFEKSGKQVFVLGNDIQRDWIMKRLLYARI